MTIKNILKNIVKIQQDFATKHNWDGLINFYTKAVKENLPKEYLSKVIINDTKFKKLKSDMEKCMIKIKKEFLPHKNVKALNFWYYWDGVQADSTFGALEVYYPKKKSSSWAGEYADLGEGKSNMIDGPDLYYYLNFNRKEKSEEMDPFLEKLLQKKAGLFYNIAYEYIDAVFLAALGMAFDNQKINLPMAFGNDSYISRVILPVK